MAFRTFALAALAALGLVAAQAGAQTLEKTKLTIGVGGKPLLYYLPLTIAETRGFFKEAGLQVETNDFGGGSRALQALLGGSVDVVTGAYEHTIRMQTKGQDVRAVLELGRFPGIVLAVKKDKAAQIRTPADLKGMKIGVTAPGSSTNFFVNFLMAKAGVNPKDAAFIGVGTGLSAVAAIKRGEIDAIANLDPVISKLETDGDVVVAQEWCWRLGVTHVLQDLAFVGGNACGGEESSVLGLLDRGAHHWDDVGERTVDKGGSVGRQTRERHTREMVVGTCHASRARARQIRGVRQDG